MGYRLSAASCGLLALAALLNPAVARAEEPQTAAVMPLRSKTLDPTTVSVLDNLLVAAVAERGTLETIGPADVGALVGLEKLKETLGCDDVACAAEIGGALGVRYLLVGTVDRLGSSVVLTLSLLDTAASQVVGRQRHKVPADEDAYYDAINEVVDRFLAQTGFARRGAVEAAPSRIVAAGGSVTGAAVEAAAPASTAGAEASGWIRVTSSENGRILLDGEDTGLMTPNLLARVAPGAHVVTVVAGSKSGAASVEVAAGGTHDVSVATDEVITGSVRFDSQPPGARIFLDEQEIGVAPHLATAVPIGRHTVRMQSAATTTTHAVEVAADGLVEVYHYPLSGFEAVGLGRPQFEDWMRSGLSYEAWASARNEESLALEVGKWSLLGAAPLLIGVNDVMEEVGGETAMITFIMAGVTAGVAAIVCFVVDAVDVGSVPASLPPAL